MVKQLLFYSISLLFLLPNFYCDKVDQALLKFCAEIENIDLCQQIINFTELPMDESLVKDLLFLKNPKSSFTYEKVNGHLTRINTIIDDTGKSSFVAYLQDKKVYKFSNEFIYKGKKLTIATNAKKLLWKKLLDAIPNSKTTVKLDKNGGLQLNHLSRYRGHSLKIKISTISYQAKLAHIRVVYAD